MKINKHIALIGLSGSGKSTIAKVFVNTNPQYKLIDTDRYIVEKQKQSVNQIFQVNGETYFRNLENNLIKFVFPQAKPHMIACGGGLPCYNNLIQTLKDNCTVIYLFAHVDVLLHRLENQSAERPLLAHQNLQNKLSQLLNSRKAIYNQAHHIVDVSNKSIEDIVIEIKNITDL